MVTVSGSYSPESNIFARPPYHCKSVEVKYVLMLDVAESSTAKYSALYASSAVKLVGWLLSIQSMRSSSLPRRSERVNAVLFHLFLQVDECVMEDLIAVKVLYLLFHTLAQL